MRIFAVLLFSVVAQHHAHRRQRVAHRSHAHTPANRRNLDTHTRTHAHARTLKDGPRVPVTVEKESR